MRAGALGPSAGGRGAGALALARKVHTPPKDVPVSHEGPKLP
jgi:hypothetical protein